MDNVTISVGETFVYPTVTAKDENGNPLEVTRTGTVDNTQEGDYLIIYSATSGTVTEELQMTVTVTASSQTGYYNSVTNTTIGTTLYNQLYTLLGQNNDDNGSSNPRYQDAKVYLVESDVDTTQTDKLRGIYDGKYFPRQDWITGGNPWNREHVWPQSFLGANATESGRNRASDAHNLRVCDSSTNSSRGNKYFSNDNTTNSYFPGDRDKGDVARILLYMDVRYTALSLVNGAPVANSQTFGDLSLLLQWHQEDPVDDFEIQRNNVIYNLQGNRNPFIDHPEWFEVIWNYVSSRARSRSQALETYNQTINQLSTNLVTYVDLSNSDSKRGQYIC